MDGEKPRLGTVRETLLIPLCARAVENHKEQALLRDARAEEIVASIDYDVGRFDDLPSLTGALLRTLLFDRWVTDEARTLDGRTRTLPEIPNPAFLSVMEMITMCVIDRLDRRWAALRETSATQLPAPLRTTRQRKAVMSALHQQAGFSSAQELHEAMEADGITIGLTTVYRTLHALDRSGQVDVVRERSGERLYRPRPADGHRHYLVCRDCGLSAEVEADTVERWAEKVAEVMGFAEVEHTVELSGVCNRCRFTRNTPPAPADRHA